jgi:fatty acid desaturase
MSVNILGWIIVGLMVAAVFQNVKARREKTTSLGTNAPLIAAIVTVNIMSVLDASSTIYLVAHNHSSEMNPVMNALIGRSYLLFFGVKLSITLVATLICWHYYERKRRARSILRVTSRIYCALMAWHCLLLSSVLLSS